MSELPIWRIPNTAWTVRGAADLFVAEYFEGHRKVTDFNNEELTFTIVDGRATYKIVVTDKWISIFRQKEN